MTTPRLALTGARGRLAPGLKAALEDAGARVTAFSRTADASHHPLERLTDPEVLAKFEAILHLGWSSVPLVSERNPGQEEREDMPFLRAMAEAAGAMSSPPRLIFFSTAAVYGDTPVHPATEESPCVPLGRYAEAKLRAETIVAAVPRSCILRVTNVFGSLSTAKPQGIIPLLYRACHEGSPVTIWGDGSATKDYLHGDDLAAAVVAVALKPVSGIYNVASGHSLSLHEIIDLVETASGRRLVRSHAEHFPWDVSYSVVSPARLTVATGWRARHNPVDSIRRMMKE